MLKAKSSHLFNFFTGLVLSILCLLLNYLTHIDFKKLSLPKDKPAFSATGINASLYESNGVMLYDFMAESGTEFPDSNVINLSYLTVKSFDKDKSNLTQQLTSNNGWVDTKTSQAFLGDNVVITIFNVDPSQNIIIKTKNVSIDSHAKVANTSEKIQATQGKSILTGNGVKVDYDKQILTIESNVKVIYVTK
ncbi:MAG: LPS export ABC transporter periplasmic protein LptC [Burkholderiales bacterium]|nr:LPS export ABC transporter periplasmic protein LptC [Burkholderiales bacterium]